MARLDGKEAVREAVLEVAKLATAAAYRAPQLTGRLDLKTEIVTGKDLDPVIEYFGEISKIAPVMYFDYYTLKYFRDRGEPLPVLLLGADLTRSELGWDCGACGFDTCAAFNAYVKKNKEQLMGRGPSCIWKMMDFSAACDFACASVAQNRFDCRAMGTMGAAMNGVGYMPDCSVHTALPIGPAGDFIYFSRWENLKSTTYDQHRQAYLRTSPTNWMTFPGSTKPCIKTKADWWNNMEYIKWDTTSEEEQQFVNECMERLVNISMKHMPEVTAWYERKGNEKA